MKNDFGRSTNGFSGVGLKGKGSTPSPNLKHSFKLCPKKTDKERGAQKEERKEYKLLDKDAATPNGQILLLSRVRDRAFDSGLIPTFHRIQEFLIHELYDLIENIISGLKVA